MKNVIALSVIACIFFTGCVSKKVSKATNYSVSATVSNAQKDAPVAVIQKQAVPVPSAKEELQSNGYVKFIQADEEPMKDVFFKVRLFHKKEGKYYKVCNLGRVWKDSESIDLKVPVGVNYFSFSSGDIDTYLRVEVAKDTIVPVKVAMSQGIVSRTITPYGSEVKKSFNLFADVLPSFAVSLEKESNDMNILDVDVQNCSKCGNKINGARFFLVYGKKICTDCRNKNKL